MITFDKVSLQKFRDQQVGEIFVHFVQKGCEGNKVEVLTEVPSAETNLVWFETPDGLRIATLTTESEKLSGSRLTQVGTKWIFTSDKVAGRCGCGSSFRFAGDPAKTPKEFVNISLLEAGTSHILGDGNYFVYGEGTTEITSEGNVVVYSLEMTDSSNISIRLANESASAELRSIVIGKNAVDRDFSSLGEVFGTSNRYHHDALVLVSEGGRVNARISAMVHPNSAAYDVNVHESVLLLGATGSARGIPELKVASEDGLASHSATMERVSGDMLAYLESRGISNRAAQKIYLSARIANTYAGLAETTIAFLQNQIFKTLGL